MKIHDVEPNSLAWLQLRSGVITASEADALVTPLWKARTGKGLQSYLAQKLAERWIGGPLPGFMDVNMEIGHILESECIPACEWKFNETIQRVGFVTSDSGEIGCSPDGLIGDEGGIEIKCPTPAVHMKYLLEDTIPEQYLAQVQFSLFVTGRKWWRFVSYHRRMPMLVKTVVPDKVAHIGIEVALSGFLNQMREGWKKLVELNGGKEPTRKTFTQVEHDAKMEEPQGITP